MAAAAARVPLIVHTIHIAPFVAVGGARRRFYVEAERACAGLGHLLIAVSRGMQRAYLDAAVGDGVAIPVIHSGMALEKFETDPAAARALVGDAHLEAQRAVTELRNLALDEPDRLVLRDQPSQVPQREPRGRPPRRTPWG